MPKSFHDLVAFQRALDVTTAIYKVTEAFPAHERYGLTSQVRKASISVVSHIAEGQGRLTFGEWRQFLSQARGSLYEVEAQCIAANKLDYLSADDLQRLTFLIRKAGRALAGLIRWVQAAERRQQPSNRATQQPVNAKRPRPHESPPPKHSRT